ncbi:MAG: hypothetical protein SFU86_00295 [Pirellulaceae bacterium]|nr:hypothetical protein [Pirellulaceae bacterium]
MKLHHTIAAALPLLLLCSCKGLLTRDSAAPSPALPAALQAAQTFEQPGPNLVPVSGGAVATQAGPGASLLPAAGMGQAGGVGRAPAVPAMPRGNPFPVQRASFNYPPSLPPAAWTGQPDGSYAPSHPSGHHGPSCPCCGPRGKFRFSHDEPEEVREGMTWVPDGIKCPWPKDEYICDGGDLNGDVHVKKDWTVVGLDQEDTIAHYDTLDGKTEVSASNCVCIYAPRFAAVRQVMTPILTEGHERMAGVEKPTKLNLHEENRGPTTAIQPEQIVAQLGLDAPPVFRNRTRGVGVEQSDRLVLAEFAFLPHENLKLIQRGQYDAHEKPRLAALVNAAVIWTNNQAVQVLIDGKPAVEAKALSKPQETVVYERFGKPCLRICKIADKSEAQVGEIVTFTLRFDNVGDQKIGNVTIIDHLMPRLEYIEGSQECSHKSEFHTQQQFPDETLVLRWEIADPLILNEGGIIRFQARVR